jgi:hypothetical protein
MPRALTGSGVCLFCGALAVPRRNRVDGNSVIVGHGTVELLLSRAGGGAKMQCLTSWSPRGERAHIVASTQRKSWGSEGRSMAQKLIAHVVARAQCALLKAHGGMAKAALTRDVAKSG